ncbi:MAG: hypothetical protein ABIC04_07135 [Nanoarchaeota archaeon]
MALGNLINKDNIRPLFRLIYKREYTQKYFDDDDDERIAKLEGYDGHVKKILLKLKDILINEERIIQELISNYSFKKILRLFSVIISKEYVLLTYSSQFTGEEFLIDDGLNLHVEEASKELIELVRLLEDEVDVVNSTEKENKEAIGFVNYLVEVVEKKQIQTIVFLDKSARPFSYAFLLVYKKRHMFNRPKIFNINWPRFSNYRLTDELKASANSKFFISLSKNCKGKNVLVVDEYSSSGHTIESATFFIKRYLQPKNIYSKVFAEPKTDGKKSATTFIQITEDLHNWVKGVEGTGLVDSGKGYSKIFLREFGRYKIQYEYLNEKITKAKKHIEEAVRRYG